MVRIFVGTSHINVLYMILYARATQQPGHKDILLLDAVKKRRSLISLLVNTKKLYNWEEIIDLSIPIDDTGEVAPGLLKRITRKLKENKVLKPFYQRALKKYQGSKDKALRNQLMLVLGKYGAVVELNLLTQTLVNEPLLSLFPNATVNYFEHGMGDYLFVQSAPLPKGRFYGVFAEPYKRFLETRKKDSSFVQQLPGLDGFGSMACEAMEIDENATSMKSKLEMKGLVAVVLMDSMEVYQVADNYWTDYIDLCLSKVSNPNQYTFVIKPHHNQSAYAIELTKQHLINKKCKFIFLDDKVLMNYSIEVLNAYLLKNADYLFTGLSSAVFYSAVIYGNAHTKYYYAYEFIRSYIKRSPAQFVSTFLSYEELIREVFSEKAFDASIDQK